MRDVDGQSYVLRTFRHDRVIGKSFPSLALTWVDTPTRAEATNRSLDLRTDVSMAHDPLGCMPFVPTQPVSACAAGASSKYDRWLFLHDRSEPCLN